MENLLEAIKANFGKKNLIVATVISGKLLGESALFDGLEMLYTTSNQVEWRNFALCECTDGSSCVSTFDGTRIFIEAISQTTNLVICGAGFVATEIVRFAKLLNFSVTVIDDRIDFIGKAIEAGADKTICDSFKVAVRTLDETSNCYFIVATRGHRYDKECLSEIFEKNYKYLGLMSSKARFSILKKELLENGVPKSVVDSIFSPIGIEIGSETPQEIALSIVSQIVKVKNSAKASFGFPQNFLENMPDLSKIRGALCTIISKRGSAPREVGAKMLVLENGLTIDTIGGGCVEANVRNAALDCISSRTARCMTHNMTTQEAEEEGLVCGGIIEVLIQPID